MRSVLKAFPTERLTLYKKDNSRAQITAVVDEKQIFSEDEGVIIEDGDIFERILPNGIKEYYQVLEPGFYKGQHSIPDNYQSKVQKISKNIAEQTMNEDREQKKCHKLFISHSSKDVNYVEAFVNLLESIGLHDDEIICSSIPPYCVPLGNKVYDWLVNEFQQSELHVVYALSDDYYASPASLNEMGAAWAMKQKWTGLLMPGFSFDKISGCIDRTQVCIKLDDTDRRTLNYRLGELKDDLCTEFSLRPISAAVWERKRDAFLDEVQKATENKNEESGMGLEDDRRYYGAGRIEDEEFVPLEQAFLLVYAAAGSGQLTRIQTLGTPPQISADKKEFMADLSQRESARWQEALDMLVDRGWVKPAGRKGMLFEVTGTGYKVADWLKENMGIDTSREPLDEIKGFEERV